MNAWWTPAEQWSSMLFALWFLPMAKLLTFNRHNISKASAPSITTIVLSLIASITDINTLHYFSIAIGCLSFLTINAATILWGLSCIMWMPISSYLAVKWHVDDALMLKLLVVIISIVGVALNPKTSSDLEGKIST